MPRKTLWALLVACALTTAGCESMSWEAGAPTATHAMAAPQAAAAGFVAEVPAAEQLERKIVRSADVSLQVDDLDEAGREIAQLADASGGFVLSSSRTRYQIKVPARGLDAALEQIEALGEVTGRSLYGEDVTAEYVDLDVRLRNAHAARESYEALLRKAQTVEEILKVEQALRETQERIELLEGRRKYLDQHLALSDVTISLAERRRPGPLQVLWDVVRWPFEKLWWL